MAAENPLTTPCQAKICGVIKTLSNDNRDKRRGHVRQVCRPKKPHNAEDKWDNSHGKAASLAEYKCFGGGCEQDLKELHVTPLVEGSWSNGYDAAFATPKLRVQFPASPSQLQTHLVR